MMHSTGMFHHIMDDRKVPLALLLRKPGDECYYIYDLGDNFEHTLVLESILPHDESSTESRCIELISGSGACPPEDSNGLQGKGNGSYADFLEEYKANPKSAKSIRAMRDIQTEASNYNSSWLTGRPVPFRPLEYDLAYHRRLLGAMVQGPTVTKPGDLHTFGEESNCCNLCKDRLKPLMSCSQCKVTKYCCRECQKKDWKEHKKNCLSN